MADKGGYLVPTERIDNAIVELRDRKAMLSHDLASLYGVSTRRLNEQVKRNPGRFPPDFMFQLAWEEAQASRSQFVTLGGVGSRSQFAALKRGGHIKYLPYAFSEHRAAEWSEPSRETLRLASAVPVGQRVRLTQTLRVGL